MLEDDEDDSDTSAIAHDVDMLAELNKIDMSDDEGEPSKPSSSFKTDDDSVSDEQMARASAKILVRTNEVFNMNRASSKMKNILQLISGIIAQNDKAIIVSQWTSVLILFVDHLNAAGITYVKFAGDTPVSKRNEIVDEFNKPTGSQV